MKLKIVGIEGGGKLQNEVVWLEATKECSLRNYLLGDAFELDNEHRSQALCHVFWFPAKMVARGDFIALRTKCGTDAIIINHRGTTTHTFFWNLKWSVWEMDATRAVLFHLRDWNTPTDKPRAHSGPIRACRLSVPRASGGRR